MNPSLATWMVTLFEIYLTIGAVFAVAFAWKGVGRVDAAAEAGTWGFRLLIVPGAAALWPLLARRWRRGGEPPVERNPHRDRVRQDRVRQDRVRQDRARQDRVSQDRVSQDRARQDRARQDTAHEAAS